MYLILSLTLSLSSLSFRSLHRTDLTVPARGRAAQEGRCAELACSTVTSEKRVSTKSPRCAQCAPPNPLTIAAFFLSDATPVLLQRGVDRGGKPDSVGMRAHVRMQLKQKMLALDRRITLSHFFQDPTHHSSPAVTGK